MPIYSQRLIRSNIDADFAISIALKTEYQYNSFQSYQKQNPLSHLIPIGSAQHWWRLQKNPNSILRYQCLGNLNEQRLHCHSVKIRQSRNTKAGQHKVSRFHPFENKNNQPKIPQAKMVGRWSSYRILKKVWWNFNFQQTVCISNSPLWNQTIIRIASIRVLRPVSRP